MTDVECLSKWGTTNREETEYRPTSFSSLEFRHLFVRHSDLVICSRPSLRVTLTCSCRYFSRGETGSACRRARSRRACGDQSLPDGFRHRPGYPFSLDHPGAAVPIT